MTDPADLERFARTARQLATDPPSLAAWRKHMFTAAELQEMTFAEPKSYIEGLIHEGFGIFGGKPKLGKSWWAMRASITIATGGVAFGNPDRDVRRDGWPPRPHPGEPGTCRVCHPPQPQG